MVRLKSILTYGLWMNDPDDEASFRTRGHPGSRPAVPRVCFTELKLSEARSHADRYGRLGIGFKRPFVVERGGLPVLYYPQWSNEWVRSVGRQDLAFAEDDILACFLKRMGPGAGISYDYLDECEWRIVYSPWLEEREYAAPPRSLRGFRDKHGSAQGAGCRRPRYLLSVKTPWLALIIYPSIQAKHAAQEDEDIRRLLRAIKPRGYPEDLTPEKTAPYEKHVLPMEMELDDCRNF